MNGMGLKEKAVMAILGVIALYAIAAGCWFFSQEKAWSKSARNYRKAKQNYLMECREIAKKGELKAAYDNEKAQMPTFDSEQTTGATWMALVSEIAKRHNIVLGQRQAGEEIVAGDVFEVPLEIKSFEGCLEALVKFMHELETTDKGMFDVNTLVVTPSNKKGYLKGSVTLTCAYMREQ